VHIEYSTLSTVSGIGISYIYIYDVSGFVDYKIILRKGEYQTHYLYDLRYSVPQ